MRFARLFCILMCSSSVGYSQVPWPVSSNSDPSYWNRISASFGEIHPTSGDHFHGAIDIDVNTTDCPVHTVEDGRVLQVGQISVTVEHQSPSGSGAYHRRTRYLHVSRESVALNDNVETFDEIGLVDNNSNGNGDHLHFEMWQFQSGVWFKLNPLQNSTGWQLNSPPDVTAPEVNDLYVLPITQTNGVASGFIVPQTNGAITTTTERAKVHFLDRDGSTGNLFNSALDKLVVYGNLVNVVSARDPSINSTASSGLGLTVHRLRYYIDNALKYDVNFDKFLEQEQFSINEIFHTEYNTNGSHLYGNNDFIESYTLDNEDYTSFDMQINNELTNGIWYTKAPHGTPVTYRNTPTSVAAYPDNARYRDGTHTLRFWTSDAVGLTNEASLTVIVDNFKPHVKE